MFYKFTVKILFGRVIVVNGLLAIDKTVRLLRFKPSNYIIWVVSNAIFCNCWKLAEGKLIIGVLSIVSYLRLVAFILLIVVRPESWISRVFNWERLIINEVKLAELISN